jgi:hypothetical protein
MSGPLNLAQKSTTQPRTKNAFHTAVIWSSSSSKPFKLCFTFYPTHKTNCLSIQSGVFGRVPQSPDLRSMLSSPNARRQQTSFAPTTLALSLCLPKPILSILYTAVISVWVIKDGLRNLYKDGDEFALDGKKTQVEYAATSDTIINLTTHFCTLERNTASVNRSWSSTDINKRESVSHSCLSFMLCNTQYPFLHQCFCSSSLVSLKQL